MSEEAQSAYLRAFALDSSQGGHASFELSEFGWSESHFSELRAMLNTDTTEPRAPTSSNGPRRGDSVIQAAQEQALAVGRAEDVELIACSGLFDTAWYLERNQDLLLTGLDPVIQYLSSGASEGQDPNPLFDSDWYLATNREVAATGVNPLVHYIRSGAAEGRAPHPLFDTAWYLRTNPDLATAHINPLAHYLLYGSLEGRAPHPLINTNSDLARCLRSVLSGVPANRANLHSISRSARPPVAIPDLFDLRALKPRGRIAVVVHLYYPDVWDELRHAIERIPYPFDVFVSLVKCASEHLRASVRQAFPKAYIFDFENRGRDLGPFLAFVESGALFEYELVCKLHTKRSPHRGDGDEWRRRLIDGVLGSADLIDRIVSSFRADSDLGIVIADGNIYNGEENWILNDKLLAELLPRLGISPEVKARSFPGGSIFWIRPFLLRILAAADIKLDDFEPEPIAPNGGMAHAVERMFGLICEDAGMRIVESNQLAEPVQKPEGSSSKVHIVAFYLPQFHPVKENDEWWGNGFTEWANVTRAKPQFEGHRQPRLPSDLGFYDLRLPETREAQAELARRYGVTAFCYYYYWFDGRRILERPLNEVLESGKPDFPFLICWANEPWTRNWDGLDHDVLLPQTYKPGWTGRFAGDVAPLLRDRRYFRLDGKPVLLLYRVGHIPGAQSAIRQLRLGLSEWGIREVHLAAACAGLQGDTELPTDPGMLDLDSYFEFPPHSVRPQPAWPLPSGLSDGFGGEVYDYNKTVTAALATLDNHQYQGRRHRGVMAGWDSTARHGKRAYIFHGATPANFRRWLRRTIAHERRQQGERVLFINAWNEWGEGTYLEPDRDFGLGWLEAVASAAQGG
jgi:lipopolysaccharide biosynthesis protein